MKASSVHLWSPHLHAQTHAFARTWMDTRSHTHVHMNTHKNLDNCQGLTTPPVALGVPFRTRDSSQPAVVILQQRRLLTGADQANAGVSVFGIQLSWLEHVATRPKAWLSSSAHDLSAPGLLLLRAFDAFLSELVGLSLEFSISELVGS